MPAYYRATLAEFLADDPTRVLGVLSSHSARQGFVDLKQRQVKAWERQISTLRSSAMELGISCETSSKWGLLLEYPIPRRQKGIDAVLLAADLIFCLEFKTEAREHTASAMRQAEDYALDLRDFHEESRNHLIVPVAVSLRAEPLPDRQTGFEGDLVRTVCTTNGGDLARLIARRFVLEAGSGPQIDVARWDSSAYRPVPTIIEAAESLFAGHDVREIAHSHAGATNLTLTTNRLLEIIREAQTLKQKVVCFVTGIPGAGKTLAGLNVVHNPLLRKEGRAPGVFLSGNGPLVKVVRAAIERDFRRGCARIKGQIATPTHAHPIKLQSSPEKAGRVFRHRSIARTC